MLWPTADGQLNFGFGDWVMRGLGRIAALHHRSAASFQTRIAIRVGGSLSEVAVRPDPQVMWDKAMAFLELPELVDSVYTPAWGRYNQELRPV